MKKIRLVSKLAMIAILSMMFVWQSCNEEDEIIVKQVKVMLSYEDGAKPKEGIKVVAKSKETGTEFNKKTDATGSAMFDLAVGTWEFSTADVRSKNGKMASYNGRVSQLVSDAWTSNDVVSIKMTGNKQSQVIIKEIYFGGCPASNEERGYYAYGEYITLYNNSMEDVDLQNLCIGSVGSNSYFMKFDIKEGETEPYWFKTDWTPAGWGYFYFPNQTILKPGKQITVAVSGAIDHTKTYPNSVDLSSSENYVMYDIDVYDHELTYPAPAAGIPESHYLDAVAYGPGNAWVVSQASPSIFLFYPQGVSPKAYGNDRTDDDYWNKGKKFPRKKVSSSWVVDAIDVFATGYEKKNVKRLNPKIDNGYVYLVNKKGYSIYRNVNKTVTEAIPMNKGKLVYKYADGTKDVETKHGTTDPSGIDAEASLAKGAIIVYQDTNDSSKDFHLRKKPAVKK